MDSDPGTVYLIDDDPSMRSALLRALKLANLKTVAFASGSEFLKHTPADGPVCLVVDVCMPGLSGLDLQRELARRNLRMPMVFITGHATIPMSVQAMKGGAVDFLQKPFDVDDLISLVRQALDRDKSQAPTKAERAAIQSRLDTLTPRERQVCELVIRGLLNKEVAAELGATENTVKVHRYKLMRKMNVTSVAELVQAAMKIGTLGI